MWKEELQTFFGALKSADPDLPTSNNFHLPNVCCNWSPDQMLRDDLAILDTFKDDMKALTWQHYPHDNCGANEGEGQKVINEFHSHELALSTAYTLNYNAANNQGIARGLEVVMAETNTGSSGHLFCKLERLALIFRPPCSLLVLSVMLRIQGTE